MIKSLYLNSFTCFEECNLAFCKGINVFIGRNCTGKTHIMKCLAASMTKDKFGDLFTEKLLGYFKPDTLGHLVYKYGSGSASVKIALESGELACTFCEKTSLAKSDNKYLYRSAAFHLHSSKRNVFAI